MRIYGVYDSLADRLVNVFLSHNIETAKRSIMDGLALHPDNPPHESFSLVMISCPDDPSFLDNDRAYVDFVKGTPIPLLTLFRQCVRLAPSLEADDVAS